MKLKWDEIGERLYETGVEQVVLFPMGDDGNYQEGVAWNGVTQIDENPSGGDSNPLYADDIEYLNLMSVEKHSGTINAYMYPDEFEECDGSKSLGRGVTIGQQTRKTFGLAYKTLKGNDTMQSDYGYKIHIVYGCKASPSSKSRSTVNDNPDAVSMSWSYSSTPIKVPGFKPTATIVIDSNKTDADALKAIEDMLYGKDGDAGSNSKLPTPAELIELVKTNPTL